MTPSGERPGIWVPSGRQHNAARVVMAAHLSRPLEAFEDVHHTCHTERCVEPGHLAVCSRAEHQALHAVEKRQTLCPVHGTPYDRLDSRGWSRCFKCHAEAEARRRRRTPPKPLTELQRPHRNELARIRDRARRARQRAARAAGQVA